MVFFHHNNGTFWIFLLALIRAPVKVSVYTPLTPQSKLRLNSGQSLPDPEAYHSVVGCLQYLALTHPNLSYGVNKLTQFMHHPTDEHWEVVKRTLWYLQQTSDHCLFIRCSSPLALQAFSYADWADNPDDYTSTWAFFIFLGVNAISWSSHKQRTVARSSTEAEYMFAASTAAEIRWLISTCYLL
ncbi:unnamed protein product [Cuscuta europaea]|uniref:Reverse transcriptase Ty1/copia-type domain-containing protein n=1 Tax=Cuscuta europaea TaxID=41803 RepID=A0A9P1DZ43_CUSEU|nr:unnamed protein product [Cuscuta europaea]